jgi:hypothetical protein
MGSEFDESVSVYSRADWGRVDKPMNVSSQAES